MTNLTRKLHLVINFLYGAKIVTELIFWVGNVYVSMKIWWWFSRSREIRHFKKALNISDVPKDLRRPLIDEYKKALNGFSSLISLESIIKKLVRSR